MNRLKSPWLLAGLALALLSGSCASTSSDVTGGGMGQLTLMLQDPSTPAVGAAQAGATVTGAMVTFTSALAIGSNGAVEIQGLTGSPIDVASLISGNQLTLASGSVPAGSYTALELGISAVELTLSDNSTVILPSLPPVLVPASFTVEEGVDTTITIAFPMGAFQFNGAAWTLDPGAITAG